MQNIVIVANGEMENDRGLAVILENRDFLIAADGGLRHLRRLDIFPDMLIGDLDSVTAADMQWIDQKDVIIRRFPTEKDQTDLELAILAAMDMSAEKIVIAGALGGRIDQTLVNISLLLMPELQNADVRLDDGSEELFLIQRRAMIFGRKGDLVSLLPLHSPAQGVTTKGLKYKLAGETLFPERSRGISNVMKKDAAEVVLKAGLLLCVHTRKKGLEK